MIEKFKNNYRYIYLLEIYIYDLPNIHSLF